MLGGLSNNKRKRIFEVFLKNQNLRFNELEKEVGIRSNELAYYLEQLKKEGIIEKQGEYYKLTKNAKKTIPFFPIMMGERTGQLAIVMVAVLKDDKILLVERDKEPFKGYWALIGGKISVNESIEQASLRHVKKEFGLDVNFDCVNSVTQVRLREEVEIKYGFVKILTSVITKNENIPKSKKLKWFDLKDIDKIKIIPSDLWDIKNSLKKRVDIANLLMEEKQGKLF
jgi:ADP-ribose pyrophosphatase YjhB (NUDIX family)/predicted transcriptional regulator